MEERLACTLSLFNSPPIPLTNDAFPAMKQYYSKIIAGVPGEKS